MRNIIGSIFFVSLTIFFIACKKDNTSSYRNISASIEGSWELQQAQTGMIPLINYPAGNGDILKFINSEYQVFLNGQLIRIGSYTIVGDTSVEAEVCLVLSSDQYKNRIIYDSSYNEGKVFIQISNDKLDFLSGCFAYDAGIYKEYTRQPDNR